MKAYFTHKIKLLSICFCTILLLHSCTKENLHKVTSSKSFSANDRLDTYQSGVVDKNGNYLYLAYLDQFTYGTELVKIDLNTLEKVNTVTIDYPNTIVLPGNLFYSEGDHLYAYEQSYQRGNGDYEVMYKYTPDLQVVATDTVYRIDSVPAFMSSTNLRSRLCQAGPEQLAMVTNVVSYDLNYGMRYQLMDENFNKIKTVLDTSTYAGPNFQVRVGQILKSSDGGYLTLGSFRSPATQSDILIEKRDADFNLVWSTIYSTPDVEYCLRMIENNGYIYSYCGEQDPETQQTQLFILQFDNQGKLAKKLDLESSGKEGLIWETFVLTDDGGFLIPAVTTVGSSPQSSKAILFKVNSNLEIESYQVYGESVISGDIFKVAANKYLYVYGEFGFNPEEGNLRTVMTYVDQNGKIIK